MELLSSYVDLQILFITFVLVLVIYTWDVEEKSRSKWDYDDELYYLKESEKLDEL